MNKIKVFFVFLFAVLVFATGCSVIPVVSNNSSNNISSSVNKEYYDMSGVSFNSASYVYDGEEHSLSIEGSLPDGVSVMYLNNNKVNAGTYEVIAKFSGDTKNYHPIEDMKATLTIAKAGINGVSFMGDTVTYDGNPHSIEITGELPSGVLVAYSGNEQVNAGVYEVTAHFTDTTNNYVELSDLKATLTINKATYDMSGVSFNSASYTYDKKEKVLEISGTLPQGVEVIYENNTLTNAGSIEAIAMFKHSNYNYNDIPNKTATLTITKASIDGISFKGDTVTYDGKGHSLSIEGTLPEGVKVTYINNGHVNAGTYTVTAHFEDTTGNYNYLPDLESTLVISKATVSEIEFNDESLTYDGNSHSLSIEGELPSGVYVVYSNNNHINAGTYKVVAQIIDTTGNYEVIDSLEATLTINKKTIEVNFNNKEVTYNGEKHVLELNDTLPNGIYVIYSDNQFINAGTYEVIAQVIDTTGNYNIEEYLTAKLIINKATYDMSGVSFNSASYTYDGTEKGVVISGTLPNGVSVTYLNNKQVNAGEYNVIVSFKGDEKNYYPIENMTSILTINKANIEGVSFIGSTLTYDGYNHSIYVDGYIPSGVVVRYSNNDKINSGEYEVTAVFYDTTGNYIVPEPMTAKLIINKLTIDVTLEDKTFSYDGNYHSLSLEGFIPDGIIVTKSDDLFNKAGEYVVTYNFIDTTGNYNILDKLEAMLTIVKDGKYHDVVFTFEDGTTIEYVIANGNYIYNIPNVPNKKGHIGVWNNDTSLPITQDTNFEAKYTPNQYTITYKTNGGEIKENTQVVTYGEEFELYEATKVGYSISGYSYYIYSSWNTYDITSGVYSIDSDINVTINWTANKYKVNYYDGEELIKTEEATYDSSYTFMESYTKDELTLVRWIINDEEFNPTSKINKFNFAKDINVYAKFYKLNNDYTYDGSKITGYTGTDTDLIVPEYVGSGNIYYNVTSIGYHAFQNYTIISIILPKGLTSIGYYAFSECSNLKNIVIPNSVTIIEGEVFNNCVSLTSIVIPNSVTSIGDSTFSGCSSLTNIIIPEGVTSIGDSTFSGCRSLTNIIIPEGVTSIGYNAFDGCSSLKKLQLPSTLTSIGGYAFSGCISLTNIIIPERITGIGEYAFSNCDSLIIYCETSSKPSGWSLDWNLSNRPVYWGINSDNLIEIDGVEYVIENGDAKVTRYIEDNEDVVIPSTIILNDKKYDVTYIGEYAFGRCFNLKSIVIPKSINTVEKYVFNVIGILVVICEASSQPSGWSSDWNYMAFGGILVYWGINSNNFIEIDGVEYLIENGNAKVITYIGDSEDVVIPSTIILNDKTYDVTYIGEYAFGRCFNLKSIVIPNSVTGIGRGAFSGCSNLIIYCEVSSKPSGWDSTWNNSGRPVYWGYNF